MITAAWIITPTAMPKFARQIQKVESVLWSTNRGSDTFVSGMRISTIVALFRYFVSVSHL